jgi:hypothetical protein
MLIPRISADMFGYLWIFLMSFGLFGEGLSKRYLFRYPKRYPNISSISIEISVYSQLQYPNDIHSLYPRVIHIDIYMYIYVYPYLSKIFNVILFYPCRSPNIYPYGYPNDIHSAYPRVVHIDIYIDIGSNVNPTVQIGARALGPSFVLQACSSWAIELLDAGGLACPAGPAGCSSAGSPAVGYEHTFPTPSFVQSTVAAHPKPQMMQDLVPKCRLGWQCRNPPGFPASRSEQISYWISNWINGISLCICLDILLDRHG